MKNAFAILFLVIMGAAGHCADAPVLTQKDGGPVESATIEKAYESDAKGADAKWKGKKVLITGRMKAFEKTDDGMPFVTMDHERAKLEFQCNFVQTASDDLSNLSPGDLLALVGTVEGIVAGRITVDDCVLQQLK